MHATQRGKDGVSGGSSCIGEGKELIVARSSESRRKKKGSLGCSALQPWQPATTRTEDSEREGGKEGKGGMVALCACTRCQRCWRVKKDGSCFLSLLLVADGSDGGGGRRGGDADYLVDVAVEMGWERENATSLSLSLPRRQTTTDVPPLGAACRRTEKGAFAL